MGRPDVASATVEIAGSSAQAGHPSPESVHLPDLHPSPHLQCVFEPPLTLDVRPAFALEVRMCLIINPF